MSARFVLLTAAKNEERYIERALQSVLAQTCRPAAWLIMDDGSTDRTAGIVARYAKVHPFIELHSRRAGGERSFGAQYRAINAAYKLVRERQFEFVAIHDADIEYQQPEYFSSIFKKFLENPKLGIAGGYVHERSNELWRCRVGNSPDSVAGGIQMFRRACFDQIGGYRPLLYGGEDWLAAIEARMAGWEVRAYPEFPVNHFRPASSADGRIKGLFRLGLMDGSFGSRPLFEIMKCMRRLREHPPVVGSLVRLSGYGWWKLSCRRSLLGPDAVRFLRYEQARKMREWTVANLAASRLVGLSGSESK